MMKIVNESILFFSQNSLWKLCTFRGYKSIYSSVYEECEKLVSTKQGILATQARNWNESRANCLARLEVLSYSAPIFVTLQLPCMLHTCAIYGDLLVARSSHETLLECTHFEFSSHSLTYCPYINPT